MDQANAPVFTSVKHSSSKASVSKLRKDPPSSLSSSRSLRKQTSTTSLQRHPSRSFFSSSRKSNTHGGSSNSSLDQQHQSTSNGPSPQLASNEFTSHPAITYPDSSQINAHAFNHNHTHTRAYTTSSPSASSSARHSFSSGRPLADAPIESPYENLESSDHAGPLRRPQPQHMHTSPDPRGIKPALRQSASFTLDRPIMESSSSTVATGSNFDGITSPNRLSDDSPMSSTTGQGKRSSTWKKKGAFSSFMNNMLGSPRSIKISAPENPLHLTHVGYDNLTGQFTVCLSVLSINRC